MKRVLICVSEPAGYRLTSNAASAILSGNRVQVFVSQKGSGVRFKIKGQSDPYRIQAPEVIRTPRLLVFSDRVARNIDRMKEILESAAPGTGFHHLCPHVKTIKSSRVIRMMRDRGMTSFKASLNEVDLLCRCGVKEIFVAYPLLVPDARAIARRIREYPDIRFFVQIGSEHHADILRRVSREEGVDWHFFIDLDVGMHRTGVKPFRSPDLYHMVADWPGFHFTGLHGYDGHNLTADPVKREATARDAMGTLIRVFRRFGEESIPVPRVVTGGTPSFQADLPLIWPEIGGETFLQISPGTWIYWDSVRDSILPGAFEMAAVILAQVIEVGEESQITLNLGHKRWAADQGPVILFSHEGLEVVSFSEEHTVLNHSPRIRFQVGDYILVVPKHVCSTVNLYDFFFLIGDDGKIEGHESPVDGRNR